MIGLGPGPEGWLTPEAEPRALPGWTTWSATRRTSPGCRNEPGCVRHPSGNTVEIDRATAALELALSGERVAVVSGGDAGVFGMAAAVFEAAEDPRFADVGVRVLPGVTAVQAVAARAGAPLGADFAVLSLSDRLKPWSVIERRLRAVAEADLVIALYNPGSRSRSDAGRDRARRPAGAPQAGHRGRGRPRCRTGRGVVDGDHARPSSTRLPST